MSNENVITILIVIPKKVVQAASNNRVEKNMNMIYFCSTNFAKWTSVIKTHKTINLLIARSAIYGYLAKLRRRSLAIIILFVYY